MKPTVPGATRRFVKRVVVGGILAGLIDATTAHRALCDTRTADSFTWAGTLVAGRALHVRGVNGELVARPGPGRRVEIHANRHGRRDDPNAVRIEVNPTAAGLAVCAIYPNMRNPECGDGTHISMKGNNDVEVDFELIVPDGVDLEAHDVNGTIRVAIPEHADCTLHGSTVNGSIDSDFPVTVKGRWGPRSMSGPLGKGGMRLNLRTVNGSIRVERLDGGS